METGALGRRRAGELDDEQLVVMEAIEELEVELNRLAGERAVLAGEIASVCAALGSAEAAVDTELATIAIRRADLVAEVPTELLDEYERLRVRLDGVGVARLVNASCSGCHLALSATELDHSRHVPVGEVVHCAECGGHPRRRAPGPAGRRRSVGSGSGLVVAARGAVRPARSLPCSPPRAGSRARTSSRTATRRRAGRAALRGTSRRARRRSSRRCPSGSGRERRGGRAPRLSFASDMGPPSCRLCQRHGTTPVASHGTTLSIHHPRPKRSFGWGSEAVSEEA